MILLLLLSPGFSVRVPLTPEQRAERAERQRVRITIIINYDEVISTFIYMIAILIKY